MIGNMLPKKEVDQLFDICVEILVWMAKGLNMTYNEINIWIFCIIWPILTLFLIGWIVKLKMTTCK